MNHIVRLSSLEISNIKNVRSGKIIMPHAYRKQPSRRGAEILGLYGQNGSGKTAVVDAMYYLQKIMTGAGLEEKLSEYIDVNAEQAEIAAGFYICEEHSLCEVCYRVCLGRREGRAVILRETLSCSVSENGSRTHKTVFMDYRRDGGEPVFTPGKRFDELVRADRGNRTGLMAARETAEKNNCSYIFGESSREIFCREYAHGFRRYSEIIEALFQFALKDLFVIRSSRFGLIPGSCLQPMTIKIEEINTVLSAIIPGMKIGLSDHGSQTTDSGERGHKEELVSIRQGSLPIPVRMESEGILKIISVLNGLIQAFGSPSVCLVIDELDAGVFEYMLGELLDIFAKSAKGQLIFTSHNLRPLEMLDKDSIMFSTANPEKRYIHLKKVRSSRNLRDVYLRGITLGGQDEVIYEETDSMKIARAFRKAGRDERGE